MSGHRAWLRALPAAVLCAACAPAPPRAPQSAGVEEMYAGATATVAHPECVVDSPQATIDLVSVVPKDAPPFAIALTKVHVVARPTGVEAAPVPIEVRDVLRFKGLAMIDEYAPARTQVLAGGMVRAGKGARLVRAAAHGAMMKGTLSLATDTILVQDMSIACGFLEVPAAASEASPSSEPGWSLIGGDDPVDFWSGPGKGTKISVWPGGSFHRVETRGDWTLLALNMDDGSALHGWVDVANVADGAGGYFGAAGLGCGGSFSSDQIIGPAIVRAGTKVSAVLHGEPWAVVPRAAKMRVHYFPGQTKADSFAMIDEVDGFSTDHGCPGMPAAYIAADSFDWEKD